jgi:predicted Zn-dependent protease
MDTARPGRVFAMRCHRPGLTDVDRGLASALVEAGHYEDAVPILRDILRQRPGDQASMRVLAELYTGLRDWQRRAVLV